MTEPIAYLIRERSVDAPPCAGDIKCGIMFKRPEAAEAAAKRLTNHWRICTVVPVIERMGG